MEQGKQIDIDEQEVNDEEDEVEDVGNDENIETDLVHDSKPIASIFLEYKILTFYTKLSSTLHYHLHYTTPHYTTPSNVMFSTQRVASAETLLSCCANLIATPYSLISCACVLASSPIFNVTLASCTCQSRTKVDL